MKYVGALLVLVVLYATWPGPARPPLEPRLLSSVELKATGIRQTQKGWTLTASTLVLQRREIGVFGVAGNFEVVMNVCEIAVGPGARVFQPVRLRYSGLPVLMHQVSLMSPDRKLVVRCERVELLPRRPILLNQVTVEKGGLPVATLATATWDDERSLLTGRSQASEEIELRL